MGRRKGNIDSVTFFWSMLDVRGPDDCWLWKGNVSKDGGYGGIRAWNRRMGVHVLAWKLAHGEPPADKPCVLHACDVRYEPGDKTNRRCCNPAHLYVGTREENQRHMSESGRSATGDRQARRKHPGSYTVGKDSHFAKLTEDQVREIRAASGHQYQIADRYGVSQTLVSMIKRRTAWKHLD